MKIEHRFSFFIFQLAEKMNGPKIHAFRKNTSLKKKLVLPRHETCSSRRLHANFEEKQEKTYVNENLENTPKHIMLTEKTHQR